MKAAILVHESFERTWSWAADYWCAQWSSQYGNHVSFVRLTEDVKDPRTHIPADVQVLAVLGITLSVEDLSELKQLSQLAYMPGAYNAGGEQITDFCKAKNIRRIIHKSEGFWGQSVAEFGLALTLCGLRRIPQTHASISHELKEWDYAPVKGIPNSRCGQFGDDANFTCGTLEGKRVRIVGAGNIASRYASWCSMMGADVAVWDPYASEPCFHRAGSRRVNRLEHLIPDAEIFVPMVPLTDNTKGLVTAEMINALPRGCLVVQVTRAKICDTEALYDRVLRDELALAADVFDAEPVPLNSALLGRHNVVHTPHNAGRTRQANEAWVDALILQFDLV